MRQVLKSRVVLQYLQHLVFVCTANHRFVFLHRWEDSEEFLRFLRSQSGRAVINIHRWLRYPPPHQAERFVSIQRHLFAFAVWRSCPPCGKETLSDFQILLRREVCYKKQWRFPEHSHLQPPVNQGVTDNNWKVWCRSIQKRYNEICYFRTVSENGEKMANWRR